MIDRLTERWLDARRLVKEVNSRPNLAVVLMAASFLMRAGRQAFIVFGSHWYSGRTKDSSEYRNLITEEKSVKRSKEEKSMKEIKDRLVRQTWPPSRGGGRIQRRLFATGITRESPERTGRGIGKRKTNWNWLSRARKNRNDRSRYG